MSGHAEPYGPVVVSVMWLTCHGKKVYGPFQNEDQAMRWIVDNVPDRTLFEISELYDRVVP